jgi:16S rRNA (adenine1518-N6/adenine1519-N6)-dimethyltransferase
MRQENFSHTPRKRFGQNFLTDAHYIQKILDGVHAQPNEAVLEIGPGLGALTERLIAAAGHITAVEIDRDLAARLRERFDATRLTLIEQDALKVDFAALPGDDWRVVGNLPYNISSPILFRLLEVRDKLRDIHVMLQKEVVLRMAAAPSTPDYGRLSVMLQAYFYVEKLFYVPAGAFTPAPKVESAVARLTPLGKSPFKDSAPEIRDHKRFAQLVTAAFSQRRKTLRNALSAFLDADQIQAADVDPQARAENLGVAQFARLTEIA